MNFDEEENLDLKDDADEEMLSPDLEETLDDDLMLDDDMLMDDENDIDEDEEELDFVGLDGSSDNY